MIILCPIMHYNFCLTREQKQAVKLTAQEKKEIIGADYLYAYYTKTGFVVSFCGVPMNNIF